MNKLLFFGLLILAVLVISCAPQSGEGMTPEEQETAQLFESGTIAGQAVAAGCKTNVVQKCTEQPNMIQYSNGKKLLKIAKAQCSQSNVISYSCLNENSLQRCTTRCGASQVCQRGACVVPCNPVAATACTTGVGCPGNTVLPATGCAAGQACQNGACVRTCTDSDGRDYFQKGIVNGILLSGETWTNAEEFCLNAQQAGPVEAGPYVDEIYCDETNHLVVDTHPCNCQNGACVNLCGNQMVDTGETCSSCPADVQCPGPSVCNTAVGVCAIGGTCGDGAVSIGEDCTSCPVDVRCALGVSCNSHEQCASGICGYDNSYHLVCEEPNKLGDICNWNEECAPAICGINEEESRAVCEEPNQPLGARCGNHFECASGICSFDNSGDRRVCSDRYRGSRGEPCSNNECIPGLYCTRGVCGDAEAAPVQPQQ